MVIRKSPDEVAQMARAGALLAEVNDALRDAVEPGMSTRDLDDIAAREIAARGAKPSFLGHNAFPATICTSIGPDIVHSIPTARVRIEKGDVLSIDCGLVYDGFHADAACTWIVGGDRHTTEATRRLVAGVYEATWAGIAALTPGNRIGDVSHWEHTVAITEDGPWVLTARAGEEARPAPITLAG